MKPGEVVGVDWRMQLQRRMLDGSEAPPIPDDLVQLPLQDS